MSVLGHERTLFSAIFSRFRVSSLQIADYPDGSHDVPYDAIVGTDTDWSSLDRRAR